MKTKLIASILAGTLVAGAVTTGTIANKFNGGQDATYIADSLMNFNNTANKYVEKAQELEKLAADQNTDINDLVAKIGELKTLKTQLESEKAGLEGQLSASNSTNESLQAEVTRLNEQLKQANFQLRLADVTVEQLRDITDQFLVDDMNEGMYEELTIPERVDINDALDRTVEETPTETSDAQ